MNIPAFKPIQSKDQRIQELQQYLMKLTEALSAIQLTPAGLATLQAAPIANPVYVNGVAFPAANTDTPVKHALGRNPIAWVCIGQAGQFAVFNESATLNTNRKNYLTLQSSVIVVTANFVVW